MPEEITPNPTFTGPYGLRSGWSLAIYLTPLILIYVAIHYAMKYMPHDAPSAGPQHFGMMAVGEAFAFAFFLFISFLMSLLERRRLGVYGLGGKDILPRFFTGAAWGLVMMSTLIGLLWSCHFLVFDGLAIHGPVILLWAAKWLLVFLFVGAFEEYLFRGYVQYTLMRGLVGLGRRISPQHARAIAFALASIATSAFFAYTHISNDGENKLGIIAVSLAGITFCVALWRTGSLWWAIGFHATWDWAQSFLYGVPDSGTLVQGRLLHTHFTGNPLFSGGTAGPEGSVLVVPILALTIVVLFFTHTSPQPALEIPAPTTPPETPTRWAEDPPTVA